jgi:hypothetical protein
MSQITFLGVSTMRQYARPKKEIPRIPGNKPVAITSNTERSFNYYNNLKIYRTRYKRPVFHHQICQTFSNAYKYYDLKAYVDAFGRQAGKVKVDGRWLYFYRSGIIWKQMYTK